MCEVVEWAKARFCLIGICPFGPRQCTRANAHGLRGFSYPGARSSARSRWGRGARRLHHEVAVLERLRGVMGVVQVLDEPRYPGSITLADAGHASLAQVVKPLGSTT